MSRAERRGETRLTSRSEKKAAGSQEREREGGLHGACHPRGGTTQFPVLTVMYSKVQRMSVVSLCRAAEGAGVLLLENNFSNAVVAGFSGEVISFGLDHFYLQG